MTHTGHIITRIILALTLLSSLAVGVIAATPAAHASGAPTIALARISNSSARVWGQNFTPNGGVRVVVYDDATGFTTNTETFADPLGKLDVTLTVDPPSGACLAAVALDKTTDTASNDLYEVACWPPGSSPPSPPESPPPPPSSSSSSPGLPPPGGISIIVDARHSKIGVLGTGFSTLTPVNIDVSGSHVNGDPWFHLSTVMGVLPDATTGGSFSLGLSQPFSPCASDYVTTDPLNNPTIDLSSNGFRFIMVVTTQSTGSSTLKITTVATVMCSDPVIK